MPHHWKPIEDLPGDWSGLTDGELEPLLQFWNDQRGDLQQGGLLEKFNTRLAREWAIETGQIEGVYDIDRGVTQTLIERGIQADLIPRTPGQRTPELVAAIIRDHEDVLEGLFQFVTGDRPLSRGYVHEIHAALMRHQDTATVVDQFGNIFETELLKGRYKQRPNNPTRPDGTLHEYCPPEHVEAEMDRLIAWHAEHAARGVPVEVEAAWLHHRFAEIHPYQDGNGRVARALASLVFLKRGWFPVVVTRDDRVRYLDALEVADEGDLRSLAAFFVEVEKHALFQATQVAADVQPAETVEEAIAAAKRLLTGAGRRLVPNVWLKSKTTADRLMEIAVLRLEEVSVRLGTEIGISRPDLQSDVAQGRRGTSDYSKAALLTITTETLTRIEVRGYAIGSKYRGLIGIIVVVISLSGGQEDSSEEPFQVNYAESYESAERRFRPWLERSLARALTLWRQGL